MSAAEPIRGLPGPLPPGERVLWQGAPRWPALARRAVLSALSLLPLALAAVGLLAFFAWLAARTTVYTVTDRRVVMRFGIALPMTVNIPFRIIGSAALRTYPDGTGDIPLALAGDDRLAYLALWPHARPWRFARPEPMLRALPEAARTADILARALAAAAPAAPAPRVPERAAAPGPAMRPRRHVGRAAA